MDKHILEIAFLVIMNYKNVSCAQNHPILNRQNANLRSDAALKLFRRVGACAIHQADPACFSRHLLLLSAGAGASTPMPGPHQGGATVGKSRSCCLPKEIYLRQATQALWKFSCLLSRPTFRFAGESCGGQRMSTNGARLAAAAAAASLATAAAGSGAGSRERMVNSSE